MTRCQVCTINHSPHCTPERGPWPLAPLLEHVADMNAKDLAHRLGTSVSRLQTVAEFGLSDLIADRWAVKLGLHPGHVWEGWSDAGLSPVDVAFIDNGWRQAWEWNEARRVAS